MPLQSKQLNNTYLLLTLIFLNFLSLPNISRADAISVPDCPKLITVKDGKVIDAPDWNYSFGRNFVDKNNNVTMQDGKLQTNGKAPLIGLINSYNNKPTHYSSFDEDIKTDTETYYWRGSFLKDNKQYIFLCDAIGSQDDHPVKSVYLYQKIPPGIKECRLTFYVKNEARTWENQRLECFK